MARKSENRYLQFAVLLSTFIAINAHTEDQTQNAPVIINSYGNCANSDLETRVSDLERLVAEQQRRLDELTSSSAHDVNNGRRDCSEIPETVSGVHEIRPLGATEPFPVYCKYINNSLWTVLQHREDDSTVFRRDWSSYKRGFGDLNHNYWLGLDHIFQITRQQQYKLRIELTDWENLTLYAEYEYFEIGDEQSGYNLSYHGYSGNAGDSLGTYHYGMKFSTLDKDNDNTEEDCARLHGGGWWYNGCDHGNLNGNYRNEPNISPHEATDTGIEWDAWQTMYSFKKTTMSVAPTFSDTFRN